MSIQETITIEVATVEVNDEYRVELKQMRKRTEYSPAQARALADELHACAEHAEAAIHTDMQDLGEVEHGDQQAD